MQANYIETVRLLLDVAPFVFKDSPFAMKGGTAINLFHQNMPRLSVDIDLVVVPYYETRNEALAAIETALDKIATELKDKLKVEVKRGTSGSDYETKLFITRSGILVKVEVNHVFRQSVYPIVKLPLMPAAADKFDRYVVVPTLDHDELYGSKLVAALDRQHPRDLFDVMLLYRNGGITPRIRRAFTVYLAGHNRQINEMLPPLPHDISTSFESEFVGMTTEEVTLAELLEVRDRLFRELPAALDEDERHFLLSMKKAKPDWDCLGLEGLEKLPSLRWKLQNLEKLAAGNQGKHEELVEILTQKLGVSQ
ncbi:nucleotidyl transferase AbiEii/AbiGii toxin family protein [Citrifermentans bremense]|uniref:nucleotidyl transferase AbiEii/AbiGii toxin family protein n=1 Tax=Citrifermentans bremense TaxID=60035 RepID=UPI000478E9E4|nr:nucleotidyl transferase AbiEii/AbiGii toxin family protein [Citrifermentans bremense]